MNIIVCGEKIDQEIKSTIANLLRKQNEFLMINDKNKNQLDYEFSYYDKPKWNFYIFNDGFNERVTNSIYEIVSKKVEDKSKEIKEIGSVVIFFTEKDDNDKKLIEFFEDKNPCFHPFIIFITSCEKKLKNTKIHI